MSGALLAVAVPVALLMLVLAALLVLYQVLRGPYLADRVVALDFLTNVAVGIIAAFAIGADQPTFLRVATVLALVAFLSTVGFAYYIARGGRP